MDSSIVCPKCGMLMVLEPSGIIYMTSPAKRDMEWRCGCGYRTSASAVVIPTHDDEWLERWKHAHKPT